MSVPATMLSLCSFVRRGFVFDRCVAACCTGEGERLLSGAGLPLCDSLDPGVTETLT